MPAAEVQVDYQRWLAGQALAPRTQSSYRRWVEKLIADLSASGQLDAFLARDGHDDRRAPLSDSRRRLVDAGLAPSTVDLALAAPSSLLDSSALPMPRVPRVGST